MSDTENEYWEHRIYTVTDFTAKTGPQIQAFLYSYFFFFLMRSYPFNVNVFLLLSEINPAADTNQPQF